VQSANRAGGPFRLENGFGQAVTQADFRGRYTARFPPRLTGLSGTAIYPMGPHGRFITAIGSRESAREISALLARLVS
jgi:hypothetical protein